MNTASAPAGVAQSIGVPSHKRKGGDSQSGPMTGSRGPSPVQLRQETTDSCLPLTSISLSLCLSLPPPLSKTNKPDLG